MTIHVILVTYALDPTPVFKSFDGPDVTWHCFVHSKNEDVFDAILDFTSKGHLELYDYFTNRGLATSWNQGIIAAQKMKADVILVINDDITGTHDDILKMSQACDDHPECGIITAWGFNERMGDVRDNGYSLFGINPIAIEKVGYFDQAYAPIYGEDVDYSRRCALEGIPFYSVKETQIVHKGSATTNSVPELTKQHQVTFPRNEAYHRAKHGGGYGHEKFLCPFDNIHLSWKITAENRNNPYPDYWTPLAEGTYV